MQQIVGLEGKVFQDVLRQVREQTEKKCQNCKHICKGKFPNIIDEECFEQNPIDLILSKEALIQKCPHSEYTADDLVNHCAKCPYQDDDEVYDGNCERNINIELGDGLILECMECKTTGEVPYYSDKAWYAKKCALCLGIGKIEIKEVLKEVHFEVVDIGYKFIERGKLSDMMSFEEKSTLANELDRFNLKNGAYIFIEAVKA